MPKQNDPKLLDRLSKLESENRNLKSTTEKVQTVDSQTIESNTPLVEKALSSSQQRVQVSRTNLRHEFVPMLYLLMMIGSPMLGMLFLMGRSASIDV